MNLPNFDTLRSTFSGEIVLPADPAYKEAANVFMHTGTPAVILRPKNSADVVMAIAYARENKLVLSVRSGGHSGPGFGTNTDGVVIDMTLMNSIEVVNEDKHLVRVGSGANWIQVAETLQGKGLTLSSGDTKTVGVGGLTLGGGIGWLVRKVGLTIDNLVAAEVITAKGEILKVSSTENPDLFWAIRGGGGNFGVVTYFEFQTYQLTKVFAGPIAYGLADLEPVLKGWRDTMRTAPEELNSMIVVFPSMAGNPPAVMLLCCYAGSDEAIAMKAIEPLTKFGTTAKPMVKEKTYADVLEDAHPPQGIQVIAKNVFIKEFSDQVIETILAMCKTAVPILQIRSLGGAMNRVAPDATAFPHRDSEVLLVCPTFVPAEATADMIEIAMKPWQKLEAFGSGVYANLLSVATQADIEGTYPKSTYERLAKIKKSYDPENLFQQNYNIKPEN
ncbi:MAG: FAD-binding oxidoreductase [Candidatus Woesebacteria bacterium]